MINLSRHLALYFLSLAFGWITACSRSPVSPDETGPPSVPPVVSDSVSSYTYEIVNAFPHDIQAFTQGLVFDGGVLYESTGLRGRSSLRRVALETGEVEKHLALDSRFFGEGLTVLDGRLIQLTWTSHIGFVYDKQSFERLAEFSYATEGWGLAYDGRRLIMSDGTANLYFLDPETYERLGQVEVVDENGPVIRLNELEYIQGRVFANVWLTERIAVIVPDSGQVVSWIDLAGLRERIGQTSSVGVLNGIAFDQERGRLFVTGKLWPTLFEIRLLPVQEAAQPF
ncbi:MAG: glutaminyl-peptide cyclotransferase [bacterium]